MLCEFSTEEQICIYQETDTWKQKLRLLYWMEDDDFVSVFWRPIGIYMLWHFLLFSIFLEWFLMFCYICWNKLCGRPPQYAPAPASWPLTFWHWKWCPSQVWRRLPLANFSRPRLLCSRVIPDVRDRQTDRQTSNRRKTKASLNASVLWGRRHNNGVHRLRVSVCV